jgi:hypothetical protein
MLIYRVVIEWAHNLYFCVPNTHSNKISTFLHSSVLSLYSYLFPIFSSIPLFSIPSFFFEGTGGVAPYWILLN